MPDSTETFLTDEEIDEADALSTDQLVSKFENGQPATLARRQPIRIRQGRIVSGGTGVELAAANVTISGSHITIVGVAVPS